MSTLYLGTNLKMYKSYEETLVYIDKVTELSKKVSSNIQLFVIPSFLTIREAIDISTKGNCWIGSQNMSEEEEGPFTGEVSPKQLKEIGVTINELGHSERRQWFGETDEKLSKKVKASSQLEMKPLLCVGENSFEKESDASISTVLRQLETGLSKLKGEEYKNVMIAYEPVWAIGENGIPADPMYVEEIHSAMRKCLVKRFGNQGNNVPMLYGGSVNLDNYQELLAKNNIDGLFIGRTAWDIQKFEEIILYVDSNQDQFI
ncbi:triose-phosphate isomerase family protein [Enterococcus sp. DIV0187]|uniref:triose-phosphate isomerase family protein n=1 Tax=Enterococcus sp. DIV0187 TaxID=2774644 RepID=UPI003F1FF759